MADTYGVRWLWAFSVLATLGLFGNRLCLLAAAAVAAIAWKEDHDDEH